MTATLAALIHGDPGVGKSWLGQSTPAPRLVLDAEGGSRVPWRAIDGKGVRQSVVIWDPATQNPPDMSVTEVCWVSVTNYRTMDLAYQWLNSGKHPFKSVVIDTLDQVQKRCKDSLSSGETLTERMWGDLLIKMDQLVRWYRDLVFHPSNPLDAVVFLAHSDDRKEKTKPAIEGALSLSLPGVVDLEGFLYVEQTTEGDLIRKLLISPYGKIQAKDRTHLLTQKYGLAIPNPDLEEMLEVLNNG